MKFVITMSGQKENMSTRRTQISNIGSLVTTV